MGKKTKSKVASSTTDASNNATSSTSISSQMNAVSLDAKKLLDLPNKSVYPNQKDSKTSYQGINSNKYTDAVPGVYKFAGPTAKDRLALVMMIKNEEKRIEVSYDSVSSYIKTFVILDTGSTDRTIEITRNYCQKHGITLHLKEEPFVNFEVSRNVLLDFADEVLKNHYFLLQLDSNDELRNHSELVKFVEAHKGTQTGFHLRQQWWTGNSSDTYFNIRMVISHFGWRYKGVVHEYICRRHPSSDGTDIMRCDNIILYQVLRKHQVVSCDQMQGNVEKERYY